MLCKFRKLSKRSNPIDISQTSISILEKKISAFRKNKIFVPDWGRPFNEDSLNEEVDVILMGRYFEMIFQLDNWPTTDFNLFCLSPQIRKILIQIFSFEPSVIGCISRYELFPKEISKIESFNISDSTHFYHAGRISAQKNIEFLILTIFYLQIFYSSKINLTLLGNFDNDYHRDLLGCNYKNYSEKINTLINGLPWSGKKPTLIHHLNEHQWQKHIPPEGLFISASNLISEDFSVTAAQLQEIGKPMLLPIWGGFKDISGKNIKHFSADLIAHSNETLSIISKKAKKFAINITNNSGLENFPEIEISNIYPQQKINRQYLKTIISQNEKKFGNSIHLLIEKNLSQFVITKEGQELISNCRNLLSN